MNVIAERGLQLTVPEGVTARRFDGNAHGLSHCMKAVDFILELPDASVFVEFKDPQDVAAKGARSDDFISNFKSGKLDESLKTKFRDTWMYEWASGRLVKPVEYWVLIAADTLSSADLLRRTEKLKKQIPLNGPEGMPWQRQLVRACGVFNIAAWNRAKPAFAVSRTKR